MKIMLVDDDIHVLDGLRKLLNISTIHGNITAAVYNGDEALTVIADECPDVVISDIKMPVMDGLQLAQTLSEKYPAIKMILLSSFGEFEYAQKAIRYGVSEYILKPITAEKIRKIEQALQRIYYSNERHNQNLKCIFNREHAVQALLDAVHQNDKTAVEEFFFSDSFNRLMERETASAAGLFFIDTLYRFLTELPVANVHRLQQEQEEKQNFFLSLKERETQRHFLTDLYRHAADTVATALHPVSRDIISEVKRLIEKEYRSYFFNISYIAHTLHLSVPYISMLFMQKTGCHLNEYITGLRLSHAKQLLRDSDIPILTVALQSGYRDAKYFARVFRKYEKMSPSEYRACIVL